MRAIPFDNVEAGRLAIAPGTADPGTGPPGNNSLDRGAARAGDLRPEFGRGIDTAFARIERAIARILRGLRDARDRRQAVRELRRLSPALLADIGIEPAEIERVIDAKFATRRNQAATRKIRRSAPKVRRARGRIRRPAAVRHRLSP